MKHYSIRISGPAGLGINTLGQLISKVFLYQGFYVYGYREYPSLIKGGNNFYQVNISNNVNIADTNKINLLIAFDKQSIDIHKDKLIDEDILGNETFNVKYSINNDLFKNNIDQNILLFSAFCKLYDINTDIAIQIINTQFKDKNTDEKINLFKETYQKISFTNQLKVNIKPLKNKNNNQNKIISGNEAIAISAIKSGMKYYSAYPMTPATSILTYLAKKEIEFNIIIKQTEDEISAINSALGASFNGIRSMVGTSGGGFALMSEAISNAVQAEIPIVIVLSSRSGPSTGTPTFNGQSDINFACNPTFSDIQHIVLAPSDIYDCFYLTSLAFNLADIYQIPVIILVDKNISECEYTYNANDIIFEPINRGKLIDKDNDTNLEFLRNTDKNRFLRYKITDDGISYRTIPGIEDGQYLCTSYEHFEDGNYCDESNMKIQMEQKRNKKLNNLFNNFDGFKYIKNNADTLIITFGENARLLQYLQQEINFDILIITCIHPLNLKIKDITLHYKNIIVVEQNYNSMLKNKIQQLTGILDIKSINKYDGRPFYYEELKEIISNKTYLKNLL